MLSAEKASGEEAFDAICDEVLRSVIVGEDEIDEVSFSSDLFGGVRSRIRAGDVSSAIRRRSNWQSIRRTSLGLSNETFAPYRSPRWLLTGALAMLCVASALLIFLPRQTRESTQPNEAMIQVPEPHTEKPDATVPNAIAQDKKQIASKPAIKRRRRQPPALTHSRAAEVATDFFPLTFGAESLSSEGGHLVRVTVPRSALVSMGLPVNVDRVAERVRAEVFIGDDGLARAIRFIQ